jgi:PAS domain S-box-containing protein
MMPNPSAASGEGSAAGALSFGKIFESLPHLALVLSPHLIIQAVSEAYLEATLTEREQIVGKYVFEVFPDNPGALHANAVGNLKASLEEVLHTRKPHQMSLQRYDVPNPGEPGQFVERYWSPLNTPVLDAQGEVSCIVHQVTNVTDQVKTKGLLRQSQANEQAARAEAGRQKAHLHELFQEAPAPIVILDGPELVFELVNPAYQQIFPERELLGKPLREALPELDGTPVPGILAQVYQTGESYVAREMPLRLSRREGRPPEEIYWTFACQARRNGRGQVDGIFVFTHEVTDQVQARKQVELILDTMPQIVWTANPQGETTYLNRRWYDYTHEHEQEPAGEGGAVYVHPKDGVRQLAYWPEHFPLGKVFELEVRVRRASDGMYRWHLNRAVPIRDGAGEITLWVGTATDIHDHKVLEAALAESEARLRAMFEQTVVGIVLADLDLKLTFANEQYCRILGRSREEVLTLNIRDITHPDDLDNNLEQLREAKASGAPFVIEKRYCKSDGSVVWIVNNVSLIRDQSGTPLYYMGVCQDITSRRQAQEALRESEERFRNMAEASGILIAQTDQEGNAIYFNQEWLKLTGRTPQELVDYGWADLFHPDDRDRFVADYQRAFRERQVLRREFRLRGAQGEYRWQLAVVSPRYGPGGTFAGFISSCIDIEEQKRAEQKLRLLSQELAAVNAELLAANGEIKASNEGLSRANEELMHTNRQLDRINNDLDNFVYAASHDLKAPIHNIEGLMKVLVRSLPSDCSRSERVQESARMINDSVERFKRTIAHLTEVSKLQKEAHQAVAPVRVAKVIKEVMLDLSPLIEAADARIELAVSDCPTIEFSEKNLRSIVYNLLSNAIKYRSPDRAPLIHVSCHTEPDYYVLAVADNGLGLDLTEGKREKLFAMFKRLHNHVEGSGIGLYMVKKIIDNAGGKIEVESTLGVGSVFRVYFKQ